MIKQLSLRVSYAQNNRNKRLIGNSKRVAWKSKSRHIA